MKFLGYLRIHYLHQNILSPTDQSDDMDFVEKNATVFAGLIQYLDNKSVISNKTCTRQWKKSPNNIKGTLFVKRKAKVISLYTELTSLRKLESVYHRLYNKDGEYF